VQAVDVGVARELAHLSVDDDAGDVQPAVVLAVAGGPDDRVKHDGRAVGEAGGPAGEAGQPW
jgi:hypothetical protein